MITAHHLGDILNSSDHNAKSLVDHQFHIKNFQAHPEMDEYNTHILNHPEEVQPKNNNYEGDTPKLIYKSPKHTFMVKPYHEALDHGVIQFNHMPIMGWSEMANQALYHAGGIGHLHQKVHVSNHPTPNGHEPMLVINLDQKATHPIGKIGDEAHANHSISHNVMEDASKMGLMDWLTNNNDRHGSNMLYQPGEKSVDKILAIDNGRSFQYKYPNRWQTESSKRDHLYHYLLNSPAMMALDQQQINHGKGDTDQILHNLPGALSWWKENGHQIRNELDNQLKGITNHRVSHFIRENFYKRANVLDLLSKEVTPENINEFNPYFEGDGSKQSERKKHLGEVGIQTKWEPPGSYKYTNREDAEDEDAA